MKLVVITLVLISLNALAEVSAKPSFKRAPASVIGSAEVVLQGSNSWIKIQGNAAKALYNALTVPAKNNQGEAGPSLYFKDGKSYRCFTDKSSNEYACDIMISDSATGQIR